MPSHSIGANSSIVGGVFTLGKLYPVAVVAERRGQQRDAQARTHAATAPALLLVSQACSSPNAPHPVSAAATPVHSPCRLHTP